MNLRVIKKTKFEIYTTYAYFKNRANNQRCHHILTNGDKWIRYLPQTAAVENPIATTI
jgi:hypothetical protein